MKKLLILLFLTTITLSAQEKYEIKDASKIYNVNIEIEKCDQQSCTGKTKFLLFKKNQPKSFQTVEFDNLNFSIDELTKTNTPTDHQDYMFFEDYNFDGAEDLAIKDGNKGPDKSKSYQIYLFSPRTKKFVHNPTLTDLAQNNSFGMFEVDNKKRVLRFSVKAGCCQFYTTEYRIINDRPQKILEIENDKTDGVKAKVTTKRLVNGKWRTSVKHEKIPD